MEKVIAPDFASGVAVDDVPDGGMLQGKLGDEEVILARQGAEVFAFGAKCTHYGGPLGKGLMIGDEVRCPLHHACCTGCSVPAGARPSMVVTLWPATVDMGVTQARRAVPSTCTVQAPQ